jgi:hypothetical protein
MTTVIGRLLVAVAVAAGAWASWAEAERTGRRVAAWQSLVTLQYGEIDPALDAVTAAIAAYWLERYDAAPADSDDPVMMAGVLRTVANAAFRASQRDPGVGPAAVQRLDAVLQAYASALKAAPRDLDAAYNYEYVARLRDQVARTPGKPAAPVAPAVMAGDLPAGPTIHGRPGGPPPDTKMEELPIITPMEFGDREAQPEATPGAKRERKG